MKSRPVSSPIVLGWSMASGLLVLAGCTPAPPSVSPSSVSSPAAVAGESAWSFESLTATAGVDFRYENGRSAGQYAILESLGGGVGILDFDRDGLLDLVFPGGGEILNGPPPQIMGLPMAVYRGRDGVSWRDVSASCGVSERRRYTHGVAIADYDNDGFDDLLITGYGGVDLWKNLGDGTWERMGDESGLRDQLWSSSAGWGDLDGDGNLDLYVAHYVNWSFDNNPLCPSPSPKFDRDVCPPRKFDGLDDQVFRNRGDGTFEDASKTWGLSPEGKGLGVVLADVDQDSDTDVYVANDTVNNFLYVNEGTGPLKELALTAGCAVDFQGKPNGSMGVDFFDFNHDQKGDLWVTNFEQENSCLYHALGEGQFMDVSRDTGIAAMGDLFVGFGTVARDFDGDGDVDLMVANGHVIYHPNKAHFEQQSIILENQGGKRFDRANFAAESFFSQRFAARGVAAGDLNRDGLTDLVVSTLNGSPQILLNRTPSQGQRIRLNLRGTRSNRSAVGARVELTTSQGARVSSLNGGGSYLSASEQQCDFYVPQTGGPWTATIHWPYGHPQTTAPLTPGTDYVVWERPEGNETRTVQVP